MQSEGIEKARKLYDEGRGDEALPILEKVLEQDPTSKEALQLKARVYYAKNEQEKALRVYQTLLSLYEVQEDLKEQIEILSEIGNIHYKLDHLEEAIETFKKVLSKFDLLDHPMSDYLTEQKVFRLDELASAERDKGDLKASLETRRRLLEYHKDMESQVGIIEDLIDIGDLYSQQDRYTQAKQHYRRALTESLQTDDNYLEPFIRYNLGKILYHMGDYKGAVEHLRLVVDYFKQMEQSFPSEGFSEFKEYTHGHTLLTLSIEKLMEKLADLLEQDKIKEANKLCGKISDVIGLSEGSKINAEFYYYRSMIAFKEHNYAEAKEHLQRSIQALKQQKNYKDMELYSKIKNLLGKMREKTS
jgi:tetratricopeptide (TPR) repeat protein